MPRYKIEWEQEEVIDCCLKCPRWGSYNRCKIALVTPDCLNNSDCGDCNKEKAKKHVKECEMLKEVKNEN